MCRALQAERNGMKQCLEMSGIPVPSETDIKKEKDSKDSKKLNGAAAVAAAIKA